jgi:hypothetical protein
MPVNPEISLNDEFSLRVVKFTKEALNFSQPATCGWSDSSRCVSQSFQVADVIGEKYMRFHWHGMTNNH